MADELREILRGGITFTAYADEAIDSGDLVKASGSDDVVTSDGGYTTSDIHVSMCDASGDDQYCVGIALEDASAAGDYITVSTEGLYIMRTSEGITPGEGVCANESDPQEVDMLDSGEEHFKIGTALTGASAADKYIIVLLRI